MKHLLFAFLVVAACSVGLPAAVAQTELPPGDDAVVTKVIDGDTIQVRLKGKLYSVRYIGVDAPESVQRRDCFGREASTYNRSLVMPKGKGVTVRLEKDVSETDKYGRLLRYVYLPDGTMVNQALVEDGYAQVATYPPDVKFEERFVEAQTAAREAGSGLWSKCAATPTPAPKPAPKSTPTPEPVVAAAPCDCAGPDLNCKDFSTQAEAQSCWAACGGKVDGPNPFRLDGNDRDGLVCEALP